VAEVIVEPKRDLARTASDDAVETDQAILVVCPCFRRRCPSATCRARPARVSGPELVEVTCPGSPAYPASPCRKVSRLRAGDAFARRRAAGLPRRQLSVPTHAPGGAQVVDRAVPAVVADGAVCSPPRGCTRRHCSRPRVQGSPSSQSATVSHGSHRDRLRRCSSAHARVSPCTFASSLSSGRSRSHRPGIPASRSGLPSGRPSAAGEPGAGSKSTARTQVLSNCG